MFKRTKQAQTKTAVDIYKYIQEMKPSNTKLLAHIRREYREIKRHIRDGE